MASAGGRRSGNFCAWATKAVLFRLRGSWSSLPNDQANGRSGFLLLGRWMQPMIDKFSHVLQFLHKTGNEIIRSVLEENHEAECEKHKQQEPKETADQGHAAHVNLPCSDGQRSAEGLIRQPAAP